MKTPTEFRNEVLGKGYDVDGYYGNQCWDGFARYLQWLGYPVVNCTSSGYVKDIWNNRKSNGILNSCIEVEVMQQGDIAIFGETSETPSSHVAIYMKDNGNGTGVFLGQNQGGANGAFNEVTLHYSSTLGAFRPKCYKDLFAKPAAPKPTPAADVLNSIPSDFKRESAKFTVTAVNPIKIRRAPSVMGKDTGLTYAKGMSVYYDGCVARDGYVWISWISGSDGTRRWMACGKADAQGRNIEPWGTFK